MAGGSCRTSCQDKQTGNCREKSQTLLSPLSRLYRRDPSWNGVACLPMAGGSCRTSCQEKHSEIHLKFQRQLQTHCCHLYPDSIDVTSPGTGWPACPWQEGRVAPPVRKNKLELHLKFQRQRQTLCHLYLDSRRDPSWNGVACVPMTGGSCRTSCQRKQPEV